MEFIATILLAFLCTISKGLLWLFVIAFLLTWSLNPTATPVEIFAHWRRTYKKNRSKQ